MLRGARSRPAEFFVLIDENGGVVKCGSAKIALMWRKL